MLTLSGLVWIMVLIGAASYWWRARGFKSQALLMAWRHCRRNSVQLLDQSVVLKRIRLERGPHGGIQLQRQYEFEFSSTGDRRYRGIVTLAGPRLVRVETEAHVIPESLN